MNKLFGIDISHWQGDLSIKQARDERGVRFVIVKAAGADAGKYKDSKFEDYYAQCKAIGMPVGAYYYGNAKSVADAQAEADHFLSVIAGKQFEYPIYYDVEGNMLKNAKDTLTDIVIAFCDRCEKAGYFAGVYTSDSHFQSHVDDSRLQRFTHWVAKYSSNTPATSHDIWQYGGGQNFIADKTICGRTVDQDFCYRDFPTAIKAAGLNGFVANNDDSKDEPEVSAPDGTTLELVYRTMKDEFGGGDARRVALGSRYDEVQDAINHIHNASAQELADERDSILPMWGWLWSFSDSADDYFMDELDGIKKMSECGFRIYEHDEWGYFFGIDGCGYSFYDEHWIPLYKKRGLQWHDPKVEQEYRMRMNGCEKKKLGTKECWFKGDEFVEEVL